MSGTTEHISFNRPFLAGRELEFIRTAVETMHLSGAGPFTERCQALLEAMCGSEKALLTSSCTDALEMAALLLEPREGAEVIVPSYTFVSSANAFLLHGFRIVFADVRPDTLNIDPAVVASLVTDRTAAVVAVHYAGVACDVEALRSAIGSSGAALVEDNAHGLAGGWKGRPLGGLGDLATLSFHETKNVTCGEGGALLVNDPRFVDRAEILWEKGTNRRRFLAGAVDKYTWVDVGSSFLPSDLQAAYLYAQLLEVDEIQRRRRAIWERYADELAAWACENGVALPVVPAGAEPAYHMFFLVMPEPEDQVGLIEHGRNHFIDCVFHYQALHLSPMGRRLGGRPGQCPVSEAASARVVRLPFFNSLTEQDQDRVIEMVASYRTSSG